GPGRTLAVGFNLVDRVTVAIGVVASCLALSVGGGLGGQIVDEIGGHAGVAGVARRDNGIGDDLAVRVDRDVALVAVKAPGGCLVPMAGLRVHCGDDPVLGDPAGNAQRAVVGGFQVLAQ